MGKCDAGSGIIFSACLPVSQSLRSDARCCDAGSGVVSPACLPVSPSLSLVFLCLPVRCCDAGSGLACPLPVRCCDAVVSPACLPVSPSLSLALVSLCLPVSCCDAGSGCLPLVSLCLPVSCLSACVSPSDAMTPAPGSCLRLPPGVVSLAFSPCVVPGKANCLQPSTGSRAKPAEAASFFFACLGAVFLFFFSNVRRRGLGLGETRSTTPEAHQPCLQPSTGQMKVPGKPS